MGIIQQCFSSPLQGIGRAHVCKDFTVLPALLSTIKCIQKEKNVHLEQFKLPKHIIYLHILTSNPIRTRLPGAIAWAKCHITPYREERGLEFIILKRPGWLPSSAHVTSQWEAITSRDKDPNHRSGTIKSSATQKSPFTWTRLENSPPEQLTSPLAKETKGTSVSRADAITLEFHLCPAECATAIIKAQGLGGDHGPRPMEKISYR